MQRSIYMSDELWNSIKRTAAEDDRRVSNYLAWLHKKHILRKSCDFNGGRIEVGIPLSGNVSIDDQFFNPNPKKGGKK